MLGKIKFLADFKGRMHRSLRGNLTQDWKGFQVTVFGYSQRFRWCVRDPDGTTRFSSSSYESESEALAALADVVRELAPYRDEVA
jgi:hypothetical protein